MQSPCDTEWITSSFAVTRECPRIRSSAAPPVFCLTVYNLHIPPWHNIAQHKKVSQIVSASIASVRYLFINEADLYNTHMHFPISSIPGAV